MTQRGQLLIVDDDLIMAGVLGRLLQRDHDVVLAPSGVEVLQLIRSGFRFDAILCDLSMPRMDGATLREHLSRIAPDQLARTIFVVDDSAQAITPRVRGNLLVHKPMSYRHIRELVARVVGRASAGYFPVRARAA